MKIAFGQIYLSPNAVFPFSTEWQKFLTKTVTALIEGADSFVAKYGEDYEIVFNVSAKGDVKKVDIRGPTKFKAYKTVEYTLFLPHPGGPVTSPIALSAAMEQLLGAAAEVLNNLGFGTEKLVGAIPSIIGEALSRPEFLEEPFQP